MFCRCHRIVAKLYNYQHFLRRHWWFLIFTMVHFVVHILGYFSTFPDWLTISKHRSVFELFSYVYCVLSSFLKRQGYWPHYVATYNDDLLYVTICQQWAINCIYWNFRVIWKILFANRLIISVKINHSHKSYVPIITIIYWKLYLSYLWYEKII